MITTLEISRPNGATASATGTPLFGLTAVQSPFAGGIPAGQAVPGVISLSLQDAITRGLKYNLGLVLAQQGSASAQAARLHALGNLLPSIHAEVRESEQQINLAALGFPVQSAQRLGFSPIVGPFGIFDTRAFLSESLDFKSLNNLRAGTEDVRASQFSLQDARELVVLVVGADYIAAVAADARVTAVEAQVRTAQSLFQQAEDMKRAGVVAGIDVLRAQVELQLQEQRLVAAQNARDKQKLALARAIGLPVGQAFTLSDSMPYAPAPPVELGNAIERAFRTRPDYQAALARLRSAERARSAASGERLPSIQFTGDFGTIGRTPDTNHSTFTAAAALNFPIFQGGKVKADIQQADALLRQREAESADMRARIELEVRSAYLDLMAATRQVEVARSSVALANEQVQQARDRFAAGVTNNIEVVQAQEALAATNDNYVVSLYAHNLAKLSLARAVGIAEQAVKDFLGGMR